MELFIQEIQDQLLLPKTLKTSYRETIETFQKYLFISNPKFFTLKRDNFETFGNILQTCLNKYYGEREVGQSTNRLLLKQLSDLILKIDLNCGDETFCAKMIDSIHENLLTRISQESGQQIKKEDVIGYETPNNKEKINLTQKEFGKNLLLKYQE
jgi:hypothetical protein